MRDTAGLMSLAFVEAQKTLGGERRSATGPGMIAE